MTEQDKQALIKHFCKRDCGDAAENCEIMPCHEIELIQEFPTTEADSDTISRAKAIEAVMECYDNDELFEVYEDKLRELPPAQPEIIRCKDCKWYGRADKRRFYRGMDCLQKRIDTIIPDKDFCSRAERRTDEA